jgi:23S rRNA (adenine2503-C2)-methyltransferase
LGGEAQEAIATLGTMKPVVIGRELAEMAELLPEGEASFRGRQIYEAAYGKRVASWEGVTTLGKALREEMARRAELGWPEVAQVFASSDGTHRYLLSLQDARTVEMVFMPEERRDTLCISTQVGCPVDCKFCLTALMGLERNLTAGEIVGQVLVGAARHGLDPRSRQMNVVMMGQGEPLLNLDNVLKATRILCDERGVGMSERRITVSTSGIVNRMEALGRAEVRPKLAISLNASHEEQRRELMPITKKWHLKDLLEACRAYPLRSWERLTFEYVLLGGVNDTDADARRVARLLGQLRCKVNLIALNPGPGIPFETPAEERVESFREIVQRVVPCFVRKPRGRDIYAACGQLKRMAEADVAGAGGGLVAIRPAL